MARHDRLLRIEDVVKVLAYVIGAVGFLSVSRHVSLSVNAGFACFYFIAAVIEYRKISLIPRWLLTIASVLFIIFTFMRISMENFVLPSIEALSVLLLIKFFEKKKIRDYMQIYMLSVFLLAGAALLSLDMAFLIYFCTLAALCSTALILLAYYSQDSEMLLQDTVVMSIISKSLLIPLVAAPLTVILFIVLPRTSYPLLDFLSRGDGAAATGFTDRVRLGTVSGIQEDNTIIFRAGMEKISDDSLYWRGIVLDYFDGSSWKSSHKALEAINSLRGIPGKRIEQTIYLEPYGNKYFFALDKPVNISLQRIQRQLDLTFSQSDNISKRIKYTAWSGLSEILPEKEIDRDLYMQLPRTDNGRTRKMDGLVRGLVVKGDAEATVRAMLSFLKNGKYRYALEDLPLTSHPLEDFLFKYRYGNCEYFASAMAVMLRMSGVPSRLVGGYRGGYYNEMGKYYLIPQKNAHVWVEAYIEKKGWLRVDPTPMDIGGLASVFRKGLFFKMRLLFDSFNYAWNASVINYDFEGQISLLAALRAGIKKPDFNFTLRKEDVLRCVLFIGLAVGVIYAFLILMRRRKAPSKYILGLFLKKTGKLGYVKMKSEGLEEFVMRLADDGKRERASMFVQEFEKYYYRDEELKPEISKRLRHLIRAI